MEISLRNFMSNFIWTTVFKEFQIHKFSLKRKSTKKFGLPNRIWHKFSLLCGERKTKKRSELFFESVLASKMQVAQRQMLILRYKKIHFLFAGKKDIWKKKMDVNTDGKKNCPNYGNLQLIQLDAQDVSKEIVMCR